VLGIRVFPGQFWYNWSWKMILIEFLSTSKDVEYQKLHSSEKYGHMAFSVAIIISIRGDTPAGDFG
jgi:hypothetical protein